MLIYKKINAVMQAVRGVEKSRTNAHGKFRYAGHEDVNEKLRPHFAALGLVRTAAMPECQVLDGGTILAQCVITYTAVEDGSSLSVPMWAIQPSQTSSKTVTAQQIGQALSYATKNVEFKLFALTGDDEPDSDSSESYDPKAFEAAEIDEETVAKAEVWLTRLDEAQDVKGVDEVRAAFQAAWPRMKLIPGLAERITARKLAALKRIGGAP